MVLIMRRAWAWGVGVGVGVHVWCPFFFLLLQEGVQGEKTNRRAHRV